MKFILSSREILGKDFLKSVKVRKIFLFILDSIQYSISMSAEFVFETYGNLNKHAFPEDNQTVEIYYIRIMKGLADVV